MKAVILAGGKGSRFGVITKTTPKPLIHVSGKPLIVHLLEVLPSEIESCIIVLGHLGHMIRNYLGDTFGNLKLFYVEQALKGTAGALYSAGEILAKEPLFLVVGSDDIFGQGELNKLIIHGSSYGINFGVRKPASHFGIKIDCDGYFSGFHKKVIGSHGGLNIGVGAYCLPNVFFDQPLYLMGNDEYSLPHTLAKAPFKLKAVAIEKWLPANNQQEKDHTEKLLSCFRCSF